MRIAIIGAGMAGLSCATALTAAGAQVCVFDKGRGPAGRMATRRMETPLGEASFDMGAQYFTVRSPPFAEEVSRWVSSGHVAPWPAAGPEAWVGTPSMTAPLKVMAEGLDITWNAFVAGFSRDESGWSVHLKDGAVHAFDAVVVALPAEQATPFLALTDPSFFKRNALSQTLPCWTALYAFARPLSATTPIFRKQGIVSWAARNSVKPGRAPLETWVVHADHDWSRHHLEEAPEIVADILLDRLRTLTGDRDGPALAQSAHRWRFALSTSLGLDCLWNGEIGLGVCGDWLLAPRVESAWVSGSVLAARICADLDRMGRPDSAHPPPAITLPAPE
jgi:predicted NAD/FAD-dependent oxidoreductase